MSVNKSGSYAPDIIQEERESIIRDANTAQTQLENLIQSLKPEIVELNLQSAFSGELDLSVLSAKFPRLRTLSFGPGKIISIRNLPTGISKLVCSNNLLVSLENLPGSLLYLDITHNFVKTLDLTKTSYLEELHCSDNRLENLIHLPPSLTQLYCDRNKLQRLDLTGLTHLKILHVSDNPLLVVENVPQGIHEYVAENNPLAQEKNNYDYAEWEYEDDIRAEEAYLDKKHVKDRKIKYLDALNVYFKLKREYEADRLNRRRTAFKKGATRKQGAKRAQMVQGKCLKCKRMVGMVFYTDANGHVAHCGDNSKPCDFHIKLLRGNFSFSDYYFYLFYEQLETEKIEIIRQKLDSLFSYVSEETAVKEFKRVLESYNDTTALFGDFNQRNNELYHNKDKQEMIAKKRAQIFRILAQIQGMVQEYQREPRGAESQHAAYGGVTGTLHTAMELYAKDLLPEIDNLRRLKYGTIEMENDVLNQQPVGIQDLEYTYGDMPSVEKFRGV
jgi:hypothetical protein